MERINRAPSDSASLEFVFKPPERSGRVVFELDAARISAGDKLLLDDAELWLERGEHVSLVGPNGAGKTTLIETLAGRRELAQGKLRIGHNVKIGYLSQHADELGSGTARTVLEAAQHATGLTPAKARALLGRFLFSGEDAEKPLEAISGGERRRLSLAILVHSGANVLILDEPTNHLDLESREALEEALQAFSGSLLLVSHDRALLDAVGSRTIALEDRRLHSYVGGWPEYVRVREERAAAAAAKPAARPKRAARPRPAGRRSRPAIPRSSSSRSKSPRPRCARSKTSSPTRPPGPRPARAPTRRPATNGPSGRSTSSTAGGRPPPADPRRVLAPSYTLFQMAPPLDARRVRVALIDEDSGLLTVLDRRFAALGWDREALAYAAGPDQLTALRLHALVVNPALTGLEYIERIGRSLPGLAMLVCSDPAPLAHRVRALRGGADDWITKPCHPEELVARIQAVLRRRRAGEMPVHDEPIIDGELAIRPDRFDAYVGDEAAGALPQGVRAALPAGGGGRAGAPARGRLPAGVGLSDGPGRPLRRRVRAQAAPEARAHLATVALRPHALRRGVSVRG